jgi:hypothetical protein
MAVTSSSETSDIISQYTASCNTWHSCENLKSSKLTVAELLNVSSWPQSNAPSCLRSIPYDLHVFSNMLDSIRWNGFIPEPKARFFCCLRLLRLLNEWGNHSYLKTVSIGGTRKARHANVTRDIINTLSYRLSCVISGWIFYCVAME